MDSYSMKPEDLLADELDHEMRIRFISNASTTREKTAQLRKSLLRETDGIEEHPLFCKLTFSAEEEFDACVKKMDSLNKDLESAFQNADRNSFSVATSRVIHLFGRLNRLTLAFRGNREYVDATDSVKNTLDNIAKLKFPSKPSKPSKVKTATVEDERSSHPVQRSPERFPQGAKSLLRQQDDSVVDDFDNTLHLRSSSGILMSSNPEFRSLAEKVDKLTESFEKFLRAPYATKGVSEVPSRGHDATYSGNGRGSKPVETLNVNNPINFNSNPLRQNQGRIATFGMPNPQQQDRGNVNRNPFRQDSFQEQPRFYEDRVPEMYFQNPRRNRKSIPINQWNVKFSGEGGVSLSEFLGEVELFAQSEQFTEAELFSSAIHLFSGYARKWFKSNYDDLISWTELVAALREEFQSENYDYLLLSEIDSRFQGKEEAFSAFLAEMRILFGKLSSPLSEKYKLYILKKNMISSHAMSIATLNITSVRELSIICKRLDDTKMLQDKQNQNQLQSSSRFVEPAFRTPFAKRVFRNTLNEVEGSEIPFQEDNEISELRRNYYGRRPVSNPVHTQVNSQRQNDEVNPVCFNCDETGHLFRRCPLPLKVFCFICGFKGATVMTCPRCRQNHLNEKTAL